MDWRLEHKRLQGAYNAEGNEEKANQWSTERKDRCSHTDPSMEITRIPGNFRVGPGWRKSEANKTPEAGREKKLNLGAMTHPWVMFWRCVPVTTESYSPLLHLEYVSHYWKDYRRTWCWGSVMFWEGALQPMSEPKARQKISWFGQILNSATESHLSRSFLVGFPWFIAHSVRIIPPQLVIEPDLRNNIFFLPPHSRS
jgi:hypothetical protein